MGSIGKTEKSLLSARPVPLPINETERLATLVHYDILDTPPEQAFDDLVALAAQLCNTPIAVISFIDSARQWFKASIGLTSSETHRDIAFCAHAIMHPDQVLCVPDATEDERFAGNPLVIQDPHIRAYAGTPLLAPNGHPIGTLCVIDRVPRVFSAAQQNALSIVGRQVVAQMELRRRITEQGRVITELERHIEIQKEVTEFTDSIARNSTSFIYIIDLSLMRLIYTNYSVGVFLGYTPEDSDLDGTSSLFDIIHPDDQTYSRSHFEDFATLPPGSVIEFEQRVRDAAGDWRWIWHRETVFRRHSDGRPAQILGTAQDVSERKQLVEEKERLMQDAMALADRDPLTSLFNHRTFHHRLHTVGSRFQDQQRTSIAVVVLDLDSFKFFNDAYGHLVGDEVLCTVANVLRSFCREAEIVARIGGDEFAVLMPVVGREEALTWVGRLRKTVNELTFTPPGEAMAVPLRLSVGVALFPDEAGTLTSALHLADKRALQDKEGTALYSESEPEAIWVKYSAQIDGFAMLDALITTVNNNDRYTRRHSEEVMQYAVRIAGVLGLSEDEKQSLQIASLIHDVGKIAVPSHILRRPGPLSFEEFEIIKRHAELGALLVGIIPELSPLQNVVRHHHERWDGSGYPSGLEGEAIPLLARILAVADAFSAMVTDRPYRKGITREDAIVRLLAGAGRQWDNVCIHAFLQSMEGG